MKPESVEVAGIFLGAALVVGSLIILAVQCLYWLRFGAWPTVTVLDAMRYFDAVPDLSAMQWKGLAQAAEWLIHQSLAASASIAGMIAVWLSTSGNRS